MIIYSSVIGSEAERRPLFLIIFFLINIIITVNITVIHDPTAWSQFAVIHPALLTILYSTFHDFETKKRFSDRPRCLLNYSC